jgi:hypothetical protein
MASTNDQTSSNLEAQIRDVTAKAELHDWIDALEGKNFSGIVLLQCDDVDDDSLFRIRYREVGDMTIANTIYLIESYKMRLMLSAMDTDT